MGPRLHWLLQDRWGLARDTQTAPVEVYKVGHFCWSSTWVPKLYPPLDFLFRFQDARSKGKPNICGSSVFYSHSNRALCHAQKILTGRIQSVSIGRPFAIGQRADILHARIWMTSGGNYLQVRHWFHSLLVFPFLTVSETPRCRLLSKFLGLSHTTMTALDKNWERYLSFLVSFLLPLIRFPEWFQSLEAQLEIWCDLKHPNVVDFLGLSYDVPFPAAIILPFFENGNSLDYIKRQSKSKTKINLKTFFFIWFVISHQSSHLHSVCWCMRKSASRRCWWTQISTRAIPSYRSRWRPSGT